MGLDIHINVGMILVSAKEVSNAERELAYERAHGTPESISIAETALEDAKSCHNQTLTLMRGDGVTIAVPNLLNHF